MFTELEKKVIAAVQGDLPIVERPFRAVAEMVGATEDEVLAILTQFRDNGSLRRFGATLKHQKTGFTANAMVAWKIPEDRIEAVGRRLAGFPRVTHCYQRPTAPEWPFTLYTMIHAASDDECHDIARRMSEDCGETDYRLLFSIRELKKTTMRYFAETLATDSGNAAFPPDADGSDSTDGD